MSKIFVLGSNSFSGADFVRHALKQGATVFGLSRSEEPNAVFLPYKRDASVVNFLFHQMDINNDLDGILELIDQEKPQYIVNFAAQSMVGQSWECPEHWFMTNALSTTRLFSQLHKRDFLKKYVHITTPEVYGNTEGWIKEDTPFNPSTPYAVSRAAGDMSLKSYVDNFKFPAVGTRAANVYGAGQQLYRIIPRTILFILLGKQLELHGGGLSQRSFIHINDVSDATWKVMLNGTLGNTFHISTNEIVSIRQLVELICDKMNVDFEKHVTVGPERIGKDAAYMLDSNKCRTELGWSDQVSLVEGIEECIKWVDSNLDVLKEQPHDYIHKP